MTFAEALNTCLTKAFVFSGRASRPEYWWFALFWLLSYVTLTIVAVLSLGPQTGQLLVVLYMLVTLPPFLAVGFRRLQDTGRSGWFSLTPIVGAAVASGGRLAGWPDVEFAGQAAQLGIGLALLYWYAQPGTEGPNAFGPDPRRRP